VIEPDEPGIGRVVVRQIAGRIARRIVCSVQPGDRVERGQRIGMIKFGSRTELIISGRDTCEPLVRIGDRTRGAVTVMARITGSPSAFV
jgi:phosphatidylserine decarboxylase